MILKVWRSTLVKSFQSLYRTSVDEEVDDEETLIVIEDPIQNGEVL